jgi:hypothetical protein
MTGNDQTGIVIQERDRRLLRELAIMRVLDREQAKRVAGFGSTTRANCRLLALSRAGLLRRFFLGAVGGARKALYALSPNGATLASVPYRGPRRRQDETLIADFSVFHQLRINDALIAARYLSPPALHLNFTRWLAFHEPLEPGLTLIPDGYIEATGPVRNLAAFLEVDLGHESRKVWLAKVDGYLRYALSGNFEKRFGHGQFRVLVIADSARRLESLRNGTASITEKIFRFTTFDAIAQNGFWSAIWTRPKGELVEPLMELV